MWRRAAGRNTMRTAAGNGSEHSAMDRRASRGGSTAYGQRHVRFIIETRRIGDGNLSRGVALHRRDQAGGRGKNVWRASFFLEKWCEMGRGSSAGTTRHRGHDPQPSRLHAAVRPLPALGHGPRCGRAARRGSTRPCWGLRFARRPRRRRCRCRSCCLRGLCR
jgi:hypothetical protein